MAAVSNPRRQRLQPRGGLRTAQAARIRALAALGARKAAAHHRTARGDAHARCEVETTRRPAVAGPRDGGRERIPSSHAAGRDGRPKGLLVQATDAAINAHVRHLAATRRRAAAAAARERKASADRAEAVAGVAVEPVDHEHVAALTFHVGIFYLIVLVRYFFDGLGTSLERASSSGRRSRRRHPRRARRSRPLSPGSPQGWPRKCELKRTP